MSNINYMNEDITAAFKQKLADVAYDKKVHTVTDVHDLDAMLEKALRENLRNMRNLAPGTQYQPINVLIIGDAGSGKSSIISQWMKKNKLANVSYNGSQINPDMTQGVSHAIDVKDDQGNVVNQKAGYLSVDAFSGLDPKVNPEDLESTKGSILFIDELNRSYADARAALLDMITSHDIADSTVDSKKRHLDNWIMTVAAINPPDAAHRGAERLDLAMLTRFYIFEWKPSVKVTRNYLINKFSDQLQQAKTNKVNGKDVRGFKYTEQDYNEDSEVFKGKLIIAKTVLVKDLAWDTGDTLTNAQKAQKGVLNARTLENAINFCDGTEEDFLRLLPGCANIQPTDTIYQKIKLALDKAFAEAGTYSDEDGRIEEASSSIYDKLMDYEDKLK